MKWSVNYFTDKSGKQPVREWIESLDLKLQLKIFPLAPIVRDCEKTFLPKP